MLSRYDGRKVRVTTEDGMVFTGTAEALPSGYGLHEFGRAEESLRFGRTFIFQSEIRTLELLSEDGVSEEPARQYDILMGNLLEGPYWVADILPEQVPRDAPGQYFAVERYYLRSDRIRSIRRKMAEILLRLNCYYDMTVSFDSCEHWERNPDPETFVRDVEELSGNRFLRAVFDAQNAMIDLEPEETSATVYDPAGRLLPLFRKLAESEGFFVWSPPER